MSLFTKSSWPNWPIAQLLAANTIKIQLHILQKMPFRSRNPRVLSVVFTCCLVNSGSTESWEWYVVKSAKSPYRKLWSRTKGVPWLLRSARTSSTTFDWSVRPPTRISSPLSPFPSSPPSSLLLQCPSPHHPGCCCCCCLLQMIIWRGRPLSNDHPEDLASCK